MKGRPGDCHDANAPRNDRIQNVIHPQLPSPIENPRIRIQDLGPHSGAIAYSYLTLR